MISAWRYASVDSVEPVLRDDTTADTYMTYARLEVVVLAGPFGGAGYSEHRVAWARELELVMRGSNAGVLFGIGKRARQPVSGASAEHQHRAYETRSKGACSLHRHRPVLPRATAASGIVKGPGTLTVNRRSPTLVIAVPLRAGLVPTIPH
ncbi:hypothetical protein D3C71_1682010 [compost metagenome]